MNILERALSYLIEGDHNQAETLLHEYYVEKTKFNIQKQELLERYLNKTPYILSLPGQSPYQTTQLMTKFSTDNCSEETIGDTPFVVFYTEEEESRFIEFLKSQGIEYEKHGEKQEETGNTVSPVPKF